MKIDVKELYLVFIQKTEIININNEKIM